MGACGIHCPSNSLAKARSTRSGGFEEAPAVGWGHLFMYIFLRCVYRLSAGGLGDDMFKPGTFPTLPESEDYGDARRSVVTSRSEDLIQAGLVC